GPGALNATIAAAMVRLVEPRRGDRFLNLMSGSGTLLVERLLLGGGAVAAGVDHDPEALAAATANASAAGLAAPLCRADVRALPRREGYDPPPPLSGAATGPSGERWPWAGAGTGPCCERWPLGRRPGPLD